VDQSLVERRGDARFAAGDVEARATLRPGCVVAVVDWSAGGALVEGARPLRPGARVYLQIVFQRRTFALAAQVLRCAVWSLSPHGGIRYRGALQFEERCDAFWQSTTRPGPRAMPAHSRR
jgi:hypothetical protein